MLRSVVRWAWNGIAAVFLALQAVPYGRSHTNPPVRREPQWDSQQMRELAVRACYDCHSNQTAWPWYSHIAPVSWFIQRDVVIGRNKLNVSEWDHSQPEAHESAKEVQKGKMPQWYYVVLHPQAVLSPAERQAFVQGLQMTFWQERRRMAGDDDHGVNDPPIFHVRSILPDSRSEDYSPVRKPTS